MCEVSDKLKLCSCETSGYVNLKHYWSFHRFIEGKEEFIVGEAMPPVFLAKDIEALNYKTLLRLLNDGNPFDVPMDFQKKDRLCLCFTCDSFGNRVFYGFCYDGTKWKKHGVDFIEWMWRHEEQKGGIIRNAVA